MVLRLTAYMTYYSCIGTDNRAQPVKAFTVADWEYLSHMNFVPNGHI